MSRQPDFAIVVEELGKVYPGGTRALAGVSVRVARGELFALVGPDGAGKTTLLRTMVGLIAPTEGRVLMDGIDVAQNPALAKSRIGYMSQRFSLSETLTVAENLLYVAEVWHVPPGQRRERVSRLLQFSRLEPFQDRLARNLSGGMKQKLSLCAALVHQPEILVLDEPTIGVDPISRREFWLILYELLQAGSTIFLSTPYMDEAERCNRVGFLLGGRLIATGTPSELRSSSPTMVLDLHCVDARRARRKLAQDLRFPDVAPFGEHLHIPIPRTEADPEAWVRAARNLGVEVRSWRLREPSLEDVFLRLAAEEGDPGEHSHHGGQGSRGSRQAPR
ncbi:MAG: ABC transporter ATP-binding protein [Candidatus Binatia bacterium]|nr:MAG: ABC transporter ATP-binding protein [Candidatus Binatia bacterium]